MKQLLVISRFDFSESWFFKKSKFSSDRKICTFSFLVFLLYQLHSTTQYHKQPNRENDFWWNPFYFLAAPQKNCMRHDSSCNYYFWFLFGNPLQENSWGLPTFLGCVVSSKNLKKIFLQSFFFHLIIFPVPFTDQLSLDPFKENFSEPFVAEKPSKTTF